MPQVNAAQAAHALRLVRTIVEGRPHIVAGQEARALDELVREAAGILAMTGQHHGPGGGGVK